MILVTPRAAGAGPRWAGVPRAADRRAGFRGDLGTIAAELCAHRDAIRVIGVGRGRSALPYRWMPGDAPAPGPRPDGP
ncbi:MAG: hypothetical protein IRZ07_26100 [Microbispora sp.]|nr:hypothetical protein [Microbispora sp.]